MQPVSYKGKGQRKGWNEKKKNYLFLEKNEEKGKNEKKKEKKKRKGGKKLNKKR